MACCAVRIRRVERGLLEEMVPLLLRRGVSAGVAAPGSVFGSSVVGPEMSVGFPLVGRHGSSHLPAGRRASSFAGGSPGLVASGALVGRQRAQNFCSWATGEGSDMGTRGPCRGTGLLENNGILARVKDVQLGLGRKWTLGLKWTTFV